MLFSLFWAATVLLLFLEPSCGQMRAFREDRSSDNYTLCVVTTSETKWVPHHKVRVKTTKRDACALFLRHFSEGLIAVVAKITDFDGCRTPRGDPPLALFSPSAAPARPCIPPGATAHAQEGGRPRAAGEGAMGYRPPALILTN